MIDPDILVKTFVLFAIVSKIDVARGKQKDELWEAT